MIKLFLDDYRLPPDSTWVLVTNYDEFVNYINTNGIPDVISFDHDIHDEHYTIYEEPYIPKEIPYSSFSQKTGLDCARWLIEQKKLPKVAIVHSMNPVGAFNIANELQAHCKVYLKPRGVEGTKLGMELAIRDGYLQTNEDITCESKVKKSTSY